ncbi:MAG: pyruvate, phosphate dikinase/phosphoenolpyruvate synthase regulator [Alphaproteobacteria bacterium]|nr:pyruvate, phosphate dikinase/phosphoenolpyruvate synthase regulator [Alphaproteobacteria bacterium]
MAGSDSPENQAFDLHLVSDSTGETIHSVARACLVQFDHAEPVEHVWPMARTKHAMDVVLDAIKDKPGPVMFTLVDDELRDQLRDGCRRLKVPCISVLDPVIAAFGKFLDAQPLHRIGGQHEMDAEYFHRIEAMDWALAHDDGQRAEEYDQSDVILVGVSRTSKTPTCLYLANRGVKAANVPYVPSIPLPEVLDRVESAMVIGLTNDPKRLVELRRARLALLQQEGETPYIDPELVRAEITEARRYFTERGWPVIDVTRRSIEETAAAVMAQLARQAESSAS